MEIELEQLLKGKATTIKNKDYFPTKSYVEPFLDRMSKYTSDFRVQVVLPNQITKTIENEIDIDDITYNRVWIQAVLPDDVCYENHDEVVGMVYGLDVRKPIVKLYRGGLNRACTNLCIFSPSFLNIQELEPEKPINYIPIDTIMQQNMDLKTTLDKLHAYKIPYDNQIINELLGKWIRNSINMSYDGGFGKVKIATSTIIDTYKDLYENEDSPYYVKAGCITDGFNVYQALTQQITDDTKDIMNKAEKTLLLKNIIEI